MEHVTCLGCGCACDDIGVVLRDDRIAEARNACALGREWFGTGVVPTEVRSAGVSVTLEQAIADAAGLLSRARRPLVYLAPELSVAAQRAGVAIADGLGAIIDSPTSESVHATLAGQRRGRAAATLGEIRRADLLVCWGVDPAERYPRYFPRYGGAVDGRVIAVDVGERRGPGDALERVALDPATEVDALALMRATVLGHAPASPGLEAAAELARRMTRARYVALLHDGERVGPAVDPDWTEALIALGQALNGPTRCALSTLRAGGNRSGADSVLTWQTGFPLAVDFASGVPRYRPHERAATLLERGEVDGALIAGSPLALPVRVTRGLGSVRVAVIGPRASAAPFAPAVIVDTGVAGIHEAGMAFRMDDVPLPLAAVLPGPHAATSVLTALRARLARV